MRFRNLQQLTQHHNWCHYMIRGMVAAVSTIGHWFPSPAVEQTKRQLWSLMYAVDHEYNQKAKKF